VDGQPFVRPVTGKVSGYLPQFGFHEGYAFLKERDVIVGVLHQLHTNDHRRAQRVPVGDEGFGAGDDAVGTPVPAFVGKIAIVHQRDGVDDVHHVPTGLDLATGARPGEKVWGDVHAKDDRRVGLVVDVHLGLAVGDQLDEAGPVGAREPVVVLHVVVDAVEAPGGRSPGPVKGQDRVAQVFAMLQARVGLHPSADTNQRVEKFPPF